MTRHDQSDELPRMVVDAVREAAMHDGYVADDALLARIQRSRAEGARGLLPIHDTHIVEPPSSHWRWRSALLAAGVAAMLVGRLALPARDDVNTSVVRPIATASGSTDAATPEAPSPNSAAGGLAELLSPWPRVAYAQTPQGGRAGPFAPLSALRPERVKLGRRTYVRLSGNAYHELLPHQAYELDVDTVRFDGTDAFRLVTRQRARISLTGDAPEWHVDTLWLHRRTLRPLVRRYTVGALRVAQRFSDTAMVEVDSMLIATPNRRPFRHGVTKRLDPSRHFVASEAMLRVLLQASLLTPAWRGSVGVLDGNSRMFAIGSGTYRNLRVAGVDTVQTFWGRYVAWRVEVDTGAEPERWYVSQESGEVLLQTGPYDAVSYPRSESHLISGFSETKRIAPVRAPNPPSRQPY